MEFRLSLALASIGSTGPIGSIRTNMESVRLARWGCHWSEGERSVVWSSKDLLRNLAAVLERRVMDAGRAGVDGLPLEARYQVSLGDICEFLEGRTDDRRIEELLWGAMLIQQECKWPRPEGIWETGPVPRAYALLKLLFMPPSTSPRSKATGSPVRAETSILTLLRSGNVNRACEVAARRLRASGHLPMPGRSAGGVRRRMEFGTGVDPVRLAAALLIPVRDVRSLKRLVLRSERPEAPMGLF